MTHTDARYDVVGQIMRYELNKLPDREVIELFTYLINEGTVWQMQPHYVRGAALLRSVGLITVDPATGEATNNYDNMREERD